MIEILQAIILPIAIFMTGSKWGIFNNNKTEEKYVSKAPYPVGKTYDSKEWTTSLSQERIGRMWLEWMNEDRGRAREHIRRMLVRSGKLAESRIKQR